MKRWSPVRRASFSATPATASASPRVSKMRGSGVRGNTCRNGLVTDAVMSGCFISAQESMANTTSAYSQEVDHHHSLTATISILGSTLFTTL